MEKRMKLTEEDKGRLYEEIRQFLADELEVDIEEITANTNIIDDLGGDSILFLEMIEEAKEKYDINIEVRTIGQYMLKNPVYTVGETVKALIDIIERGEELIEQLKAEAEGEREQEAVQQP